MRMSVSPRSRMPRRGCSTNVQKHRERPDPEAVAVELFWWDYLNYIPHKEEVAGCLDNEFVAGEEVLCRERSCPMYCWNVTN
jgi:hypothetical protein